MEFRFRPSKTEAWSTAFLDTEGGTSMVGIDPSGDNPSVWLTVEHYGFRRTWRHAIPLVGLTRQYKFPRRLRWWLRGKLLKLDRRYRN